MNRWAAIVIIIIIGIIKAKIVYVTAAATCRQPTQTAHFHGFVVFAQVLADFRVAVFVVGDDDLPLVGGRHASLAIIFSRQITLPVFFVLANVLDAEWVAVVD